MLAPWLDVLLEQGSNVSARSLGFLITQSLAVERCVVLFAFKLRCVCLGDEIGCDGSISVFRMGYNHLG